MSRSSATIVFKSGVTVEVDVSSIGTGRNSFTKELVSINWETPDDAVRRLTHVDVGEIAAVVFNDPSRADD